MKPQYPIYIPTKGRAEFCKTAKMLEFECQPYIVVIEPQEEAEYRKHLDHRFASFELLPKSGGGLTFSRNHILELARRRKSKYFWMIDDDLTAAYVTQGSKNVRQRLDVVLGAAEAHLTEVPNLAIGALEYAQYAWSARKPLAMNSYCDVAVFINVERTKFINYRNGGKHDRDFVLQCLSVGYQSARSSWTSFACPKNGSNKGGLFDEYAAGREPGWSSDMVKRWPGICELQTKSDGRPDVKIHWRRLKSPIK